MAEAAFKEAKKDKTIERNVGAPSTTTGGDKGKYQ